MNHTFSWALGTTSFLQASRPWYVVGSLSSISFVTYKIKLETEKDLEVNQNQTLISPVFSLKEMQFTADSSSRKSCSS